MHSEALSNTPRQLEAARASQSAMQEDTAPPSFAWASAQPHDEGPTAKAESSATTARDLREFRTIVVRGRTPGPSRQRMGAERSGSVADS
jgi:hypothetical protein